MVNETRKMKVVAVDRDGTLLDHQARVPERNVAAIKRVQAQGIGIILATGKTRESALHIIKDLKITLPGVFFGGHLISEAGGRILRERAMDLTLVDAVFAYGRRHALRVVVYDRIGIWTPAPGMIRKSRL